MPRRNAIIVMSVLVAVLVVFIVVFWSKGKAGNTQEFCTSVQRGPNPLDVFDSYDPANVQTAGPQLRQGVDRLRELQRAAPSEISGDVKVLADVAQQLADALDPANKDKPVPDLTSQFDRVGAASANVTAFASAHCGVDLTTGSTVPSTTAVPPSSSG